MKEANILIVEDDGIIAQDLLTRLNRVGYKSIATVASGEKALERTAQSVPDLILMDIVLKGRLDGIETAQEIRRQRLSTAVVYLTAYSDDVTLTRAKKTEPQGYLVKPVKDFELFTAVDLALIKIQNERREQHLHAVLNTHVRMHRLFIRHENEEELLPALCTLLTENRSYLSAWIMLLDEARQPLLTVSSNIKGDIKKLEQAVINNTPPRCLQETLSGKKVTVTEDLQDFCRDCPLDNGYERSGITSTQIRFKGHLLGILTIALPSDFCRDPEEQKIIRNIASDIGYAIHNLRQLQRRNQAETALNRNRNRLREAQKIACLGYWEIDAVTLDIAGSDQVYTILQRSPENPITTRAAFQALIHPDDRSGAIQAMDALLADDTPYDLVYRVLMPDGSFKHLQMKARMHRDNLGRPVRVMGTMQDVSMQKKMEQRLLQTEKMETIAGLAAGVAHELNTPLSAILQSIQIIELALDPKNGTARKQADKFNIDLKQLHHFFTVCKINYFLEGIKNSATNTSRIINNLLQFSRPKTGEWIKMSVQEMITNSIELARTDYTLKKDYNILNIDFQTEFAPDLDSLYCTPMEIEQVLLNLIKNAVHALTGPGADPSPEPCIILRALMDDNLVRIDVEDNGCGIREQDLPHIFDPFYTTKDIGIGTGLGLSIAYGIIKDNHNGRITVKTTVGKGTTMSIYLPVAGEEEEIPI
ncbi:MAG: response regulator [Desulfobulbaceae bacterium]|nr:response regulator [Desulfobulbaceae bacterium]